MFFSLVFSICVGASAPVGAACDEYVIDTHKTMQQCTAATDKRINAANVLFKGADNWVISCEKTYTKEGQIMQTEKQHLDRLQAIRLETL